MYAVDVFCHHQNSSELCKCVIVVLHGLVCELSACEFHT